MFREAGRQHAVDSHPQIFYVSVMIIFQGVFLPPAWSRLASQQKVFAILASAAPYLLTYLTTASTSHIITQASHKRNMKQYPYDHVLFHPGQVCATCQWLKPARSKHCRVCKYVYGPSNIVVDRTLLTY